MSAPGREPNLLILAHLPWCNAVADHLFASLSDRIRVRTVDGVASAAKAIAEGWTDAVLLMSPTPAERHVERLRSLLRRSPDASVIAISAEPDSAIARRLRAAGAKGHVSFESSTDDLIAAIRAVADGGTYFSEADEVVTNATPQPHALPNDLDRRLVKLTRREWQVMEPLGQGYANREIANTLGLREGTIRIYVHRVIRQLGLRNRVDVALCASRLSRGA